VEEKEDEEERTALKYKGIIIKKSTHHLHHEMKLEKEKLATGEQQEYEGRTDFEPSA
jgi:hypothetical protein